MNRTVLAALAVLPGSIVVVPTPAVAAPPKDVVQELVDEFIDGPETDAAGNPSPDDADDAEPGPLTHEIEEEIQQKVADTLAHEVDGDLGVRLLTEFATRGHVRFDKPRDDVFGIGETVEILAPVSDNAFAMARTVHVRAPIGGDLLAIGETIRIDSVVGGDVYVAGRELVLGEGGMVAGDFQAAGAEIRILGPIGGDLLGGAGSVRIDSTIGGDAQLEVGELRFGDQAMIGGDLDYTSPRRVDGADRYVGGEVSFTQQTGDTVNIELNEGTHVQLNIDTDRPDERSWLARTADAAVAWSGWRVFDYFSKLLVGFAMFAIGGVSATSLASTLRDKPAESLGIGFVTFVGMPIASLICIVTIIPIVLGLLGLMLWPAMMFVGQIIVAHALGDMVLRQFRPDAIGSPFISLAVGLVPLTLVFGLPWIWFLAAVGSAMMGMGAMVMAMRPSSRADAPAATTV